MGAQLAICCAGRLESMTERGGERLAIDQFHGRAKAKAKAHDGHDSGDDHSGNRSSGHEKGAASKAASSTVKVVANPMAKFITSEGEFEVELLMDRMPITASNFIELTQAGFYTGIHFQQVLPRTSVFFGREDIAPAGEFKNLKTGEMARRSKGLIKDETNTQDSKELFSLSMVANSSHFVINLVPPKKLQQPLFGLVRSGTDVLLKISTAPAKKDIPVKPITITAISIAQAPGTANKKDGGSRDTRDRGRTDEKQVDRNADSRGHGAPTDARSRADGAHGDSRGNNKAKGGDGMLAEMMGGGGHGAQSEQRDRRR